MVYVSYGCVELLTDLSFNVIKTIQMNYLPSSMINECIISCKIRERIPNFIPYKHTTCIPRLNDVETTVSMSFQCEIHVVCLKGFAEKC